MSETTKRLRTVSHLDLDPTEMSAVRNRMRLRRARQRWAAGAGLAALILAASLALPRLWQPVTEVADAPISAKASDAPSAPATSEITSTSMADAPGTLAVWQLAADATVGPDSTNVEIEVTRVECASNFTGEAFAPVVTVSDDRVTIETTVESLAPGAAAECPSNPWVPLTVELPEPLGERLLVDAACEIDATIATTSYCDDEGIRWQP